MKLLASSASLLLLLAIFSGLAHAQTPAINSGGVGMSDGSTPLYMYHYWSIYGSNLSTGSGSTVWFDVQGWDYNSLSYAFETIRFSSTVNNPGYWYESGSQINFFAQAYDFPPYYLTGLSLVQVCNSAGLCSGHQEADFR